MYKIFLSWSKEPAKTIAMELRDTIGMIIPSAQVWMSAVDIPKGKKWSSVISEELSNTNTGIIIVTENNRLEPWLFFEAGALSKSVEEGRVHPLVFGMEFNSLAGPLQEFQATKFNHDDLLDLLKTLNRESPNPQDGDLLSRNFERLWPGLELSIKRALAGHPTASPATQIASQPEQPFLDQEHDAILQFLVNSEGRRFGADVIARSMGMHIERAKLKLRELVEQDYVYQTINMITGAEYSLDHRGREYAAVRKWI